MDTATLVDEQVDDGKRFVDALKQSGFDVVVAFWVLTSEEGLWFLYIASPVVESDGPAAAYQKVYSELARSQVRWIMRSDVKVIGSENSIALDAMDYQSMNLATRYGGRKLGSMIVEEAYIYPK